LCVVVVPPNTVVGGIGIVVLVVDGTVVVVVEGATVVVVVGHGGGGGCVPQLVGRWTSPELPSSIWATWPSLHGPVLRACTRTETQEALNGSWKASPNWKLFASVKTCSASNGSMTHGPQVVSVFTW
jgi:hypothetical protein